MSQTCQKCRRSNPPEAAYCYYDGAVLDGHARNGGPVPVGSQQFPTPFVFPSGRRCRTFDELALACQNEWAAARELLQEGYLENFFTTLGRADLALSAREAARFPDPDRGLDRLLGTLPTHVIDPPRLWAAPLELQLGQLRIGEDRRFELHLENRGMRLVYGAITCDDCDWLALGDPPGAPEKLFQFGHDLTLPVLVKGKHLRAGIKPLEGRLLIESNGGNVTVTVRADVPARPFPDGPLCGALTPRQVAEKAKAAPKESAAYFEKGAVAQWYKENGWTYPVQGPSASGLGAVQQFFEALGLTPPPKVDVSERSVALTGEVGENLRHTLEVRTEEKRPVYAHATSSQPWLEVGRPRLEGRVATIPIVVPHVPDRPGETLTAKVLIRANGNQRFVIPVTLTVGHSLVFEPVPRTTVKEPPAATVVASPRAAPAAEPAPVVRMPRRPPNRNWLHLLPLVALLLALVGVGLYDLFHKAPAPVVAEVGVPGVGTEVTLDDPEPRIGVDFDRETQRFGLVMLKEKDPDNPDKFKRLTYEQKGTTNNTCVKVEQFEYLLGDRPGRWVKREVRLKDRNGKDANAWQSVFRWPADDIEVTQTVMIVPGDQTRLLDTCLVLYQVHNQSKNPRKVGLRIMLDTFIGANDGVPFAIPNQDGLLDTMKRFDQKDIPDYIQALEYPDLKNPGTVAHLGLKLPGYEDIERMLICRWPGNKAMRWDIEPFEAMNANPDKKDSCVTLYWAYRVMNPGEKRQMAFTYGLNTISGLEAGAQGDGRLALTAGGDFRPGREFTVTAYVKNPQPGQVVTLKLPAGFAFATGHQAEQAIKGGGEYNQVSWRVRAGPAGGHTLEAESGGARATYRVQVRERTIY